MALAGLALLVGLGAPAPHITYAAGTLRLSAYALLVGTWLGPGLGDGGGRGTEYGQFTFFRNLEYSYTSNSEDCGGFTNAGYYRIRNGVITIHWTECNFPCAAGTASVRFAFLGGNAFELADQGGTYVYYRQ
jgi:hypothetical protein